MRLNVFAKTARLFVSALFAVLLLSACTAKEVEEEQGMSVAVTLRDVHRCSRISPEILVADMPAGTESFDVRLVEYGDEERFFGGGAWANDGSGVIPEGGLTRHYRGPCPPTGEIRDYAFVVSAMGKNSIQPLAVRIYHFTQE
ncbi:MbtF [uncultured Desulfovibrio sp.]|uniref:MbtF n=1 Tax=uncultured Desulfovibrio sp. TaxID=167968 RepID=UPI0003A2D1B5|nr:MbtF [uncultured Desulfovibrio sp.]